ncbi:CHAD domain-containing protein [Streptomyces sp. NPDC048566]|uniref:CYTH and CHAD domain-containing protein n=1 Tax=Streptomyces sp. NPDC048566 TaxID=3365569 RepID=UPI00371FEF51
MAHATRETERTYAPAADEMPWPAELAGVGTVAAVERCDVQERDAVYHDTDDLRLAHSRASLRRRTGGTDPGWRLTLPSEGDSRGEIRAPLSSQEVPDDLRDLVLSRTRGAPLRPVVRVHSIHRPYHLLDTAGHVLAELGVDDVVAEALPGGGETTWRELEVELAEGGDPALLDAVEEVLRGHGVDRAPHPSAVDRALRQTTTPPSGTPQARDAAPPGSAGDHVLAHVERLTRTLRDLDPAVRRDLPDAVHRMRTTARRLRGCLRSYRSVLDRKATGPVRRDLKWLANELGEERDHEVLRDRLTSALAELPGELVLGPVAARLRTWDVAQGAHARRRTLDTLASPRYLRLLENLATLTRTPPLRATARRAPDTVLRKALRKDLRRLAARMEPALDMAPGPERDTAIHDARKAAKGLRYAAEAARPALGKPAARLGRRAKTVQQVSGAQRDGVLACAVLRDLAIAAHGAGESGFTWGLLHGQERAAAGALARRLPETWAEVRAGAPSAMPRKRGGRTDG